MKEYFNKVVLFEEYVNVVKTYDRLVFKRPDLLTTVIFSIFTTVCLFGVQNFNQVHGSLHMFEIQPFIPGNMN